MSKANYFNRKKLRVEFEKAMKNNNLELAKKILLKIESL